MLALAHRERGELVREGLPAEPEMEHFQPLTTSASAISRR